MISAYQEELITIDELRTRLPDLRAREASLRSQLQALDAQSADQQAYLKLADDLDTFLAGLRTTAATSDVHERQRIVRLLVKDVLVGPEKITIRHRIPVREHTPGNGHHTAAADTEGDNRAGSPLRWGRDHPALRGSAVPYLQSAVGLLQRRVEPPLHIQQHPRLVGVAFTALTTRSQGTVSKNARMSRSITQSVLQHRCRHVPTASSADRPGR